MYLLFYHILNILKLLLAKNVLKVNEVWEHIDGGDKNN